MFVHCVFFWQKEGLTENEKLRLQAGIRSLLGIDSVRHGWFGVPAPTDRPVIDRSYSYALTVVFDGEAEHDAYQVDPVHDRFRQECAVYWSQVKIYDYVTPE